MRLLLAAGRARGIVFVLALLAAAVHPTKVQAHASLIGSEPSDRAVVAQAPPTLKLTFNEPVSPVVLRLVGPTGEPIALEDILMAGNTRPLEDVILEQVTYFHSLQDPGAAGREELEKLKKQVAKVKDPKLAAEYEGQTYYFCSNADRDKFKKNPQKYVKQPKPPGP